MRRNLIIGLGSFRDSAHRKKSGPGRLENLPYERQVVTFSGDELHGLNEFKSTQDNLEIMLEAGHYSDGKPVKEPSPNAWKLAFRAAYGNDWLAKRRISGRSE